MIVDFYLFALAKDDGLRVCIPQQLQHLGIVIIAADHKAFDSAPGQPRLGELDPRCESLAGKIVEQALDGRRVGFDCAVLILVHDLAIEAERAKPILETLQVSRSL